tara:strand:+ start:286 stop:477 length:192 start_codon:yes stop_codon:yes gene_type:complete
MVHTHQYKTRSKGKSKYQKPIYNDNTCDCPQLQFNVKKDIEKSKKIKPQDVFMDYKKSKCKCK